MVQRRAVRYIFNVYQHTSSNTHMLNKLSLPTLEKRRKISSLIMFHKIYHRKVRTNFPSYVKPALRNRFSIPHSRINAHKSSFFPRTVRLWNGLPPDLSRALPRPRSISNWACSPPQLTHHQSYHHITSHPSLSISHHPSLPISHNPSLPKSHRPSLPFSHHSSLPRHHVNFTV